MPSRRMFTLAAAIVAPAWHALPASAAQGANAEVLLQRLIGALGGREPWARIRSTRYDAQQNRAAEPAVVRSVITMDYRAPRFRIDTTAPGIAVARVVDGERHWRRTRDGRIGPFPAELLDEDRRWYAGHVYRTIHRLAAGDAALTLASPREGQLDVIEAGKRLAWFRLDSRGEPYLYGAHDDESGTVCGPWELEVAGIRLPLWTSRPDGTWRAMLKVVEVNVPLPDTLFERPPA